MVFAAFFLEGILSCCIILLEGTPVTTAQRSQSIYSELSGSQFSQCGGLRESRRSTELRFGSLSMGGLGASSEAKQHGIIFLWKRGRKAAYTGQNRKEDRFFELGAGPWRVPKGEHGTKAAGSMEKLLDLPATMHNGNLRQQEDQDDSQLYRERPSQLQD